MQKISYKVSKQATALRLDQAIAQCPEPRIQELPRAMIRKLIIAGAVYVNGKRAQIASKPVREGTVIDIYLDETKSVATKIISIEKAIDKFLPLRSLYRDDAIICFEKPAGLPTQPTVDQSRANLFELAQEQLNKEAGKKIYLGLHHRLDRETSGVILFTLDPKYNTFIGEQFKSHLCSKIYVAVVHGKLKNQKGRIESFLGEVGKKGKQAKFGSVKSGGKKAITDFHVLSATNQYSLIEVKITTGRTHQIRVHFSEMGHPIVGDTLYGSPVAEYNRRGRFLLHAQALTIVHPITKNTLLIESPAPPEFRI